MKTSSQIIEILDSVTEAQLSHGQQTALGWTDEQWIDWDVHRRRIAGDYPGLSRQEGGLIAWLEILIGQPVEHISLADYQAAVSAGRSRNW